MDDTRLGPVEARFADLIWENAPLSSGELVKLCAQELEWKKSTTYTVLKKLCERGIFRNEGGLVTPVLSRQDFYAKQSQRFVEDNFGGSLPSFLAAFASGRKLTNQDVTDIRNMLDAFDKEESK